jgi:UDP-N-acetylmuramyl pentapeptide phosphotransferase/UDP-N-acetylglucosamine-1-phosphate transferase
MTFYIVLALSAFLLSLLGTRLTILAFRKQQRPVLPFPLQMSKPRPAPSGGGVAVVMAMIICLLVADVDYGIVLSLFLLAALSLLDDLIGVPMPIRLLVQVLCVLIAFGVVDTPVFGGMLPSWLDKAIVVVAWVWFMNLFNFMDGIDGISPTEMIGISMGLCVITVMTDTFPTMLSTYSLVVFAVGSGFLWWNWYPAKIRLGEVGTVPIGFFLGYMLLLAINAGYGYAAAILPAYYISDATITLIYRASKGKRMWAKHSEYYYRKAVSKGRKHDTVARYVFGINLLLILLATFSVINPEISLFLLGLAYMAVFMILGFFAYTPHNPSHEPF